MAITTRESHRLEVLSMKSASWISNIPLALGVVLLLSEMGGECVAFRIANTRNLMGVPWTPSTSFSLLSLGWTRKRCKLWENASDNDVDMSWLQNASSDTQIAPTAAPRRQQEEEPGNIHIPSNGVSINDEMENVQKDRFKTEIVPVKHLPGVAQVVTAATGGTVDAVRYLVALTPPVVLETPRKADDADEGNSGSDNEVITTPREFAMVDAPPYSDELAANIRVFMGEGSKLISLLMTSRDAIHYDEAPAVFTTRNSDLSKWTAAFPELHVVGYRLDIPRDCRDLITQRLDGYGPWALEEDMDARNMTFVESGRPLTYEEWDDAVVASVMDNGETPPDDESQQLSEDDRYTPEAIRAREEDKRVLAVYTPGHTFGSISYIFPDTGVCCSGFTIPVEDDRQDENQGISGAGPALDYRGYITTSRAGMSRMMESAKDIIETYSDRFTVVLPSRGDPLFVDMPVEERKQSLLDIVDQYGRIGQVYEQLGILSKDD